MKMARLAPIMQSGDIDWVEVGEINMVVARENESLLHKNTAQLPWSVLTLTTRHCIAPGSWETGNWVGCNSTYEYSTYPVHACPPTASSQVPCALIQAQATTNLQTCL